MKRMFFDIETTGLNPMVDRILAITTKNIDLITFYGEDESLILKQFWNSIKDVDELLGFNIDGFDLPFLIKRSIINNVKISDNWNNIKFIDLRKVVNSFNINYDRYSKGKLADWAKILLIDIKTEDGEHMKEFYEKKQWIKIKNHCEEDVMICNRLYDRCVNIGLL